MQEEIKKGYKKTEIGVIPEEWEVKRLGDICEINPESLENNTDENLLINYIDIESVSTGRISNIKKILFKDAPSRARRIVKKEDIIISTVRPYLKAFAKVKYNIDNLVCSTGFAVIRCKEQSNSAFIFQYILSELFLNQLINKMVGSNYPAVNISDIKYTLIILPPLKEQQKIASILSTVDEHIEQTDKLIEKTKELKKGLMQKLLTKGIGHTEFKKTEIGEIPKEWEIISLFETGEYINGRAFKPCEWTDKGTPIIRIQNLNDKNATYNYYNFDVDKKYHVYKDDLLFAWSGSIGLYIWKGDKAYLNQHIYKVIPNKNVDKRYLYYKLSREIEILLELSHGSTMKHITRKNLRRIKIPLPPLSEQQKIASIISEVDNQIEQYELKKEKLQTLKKGLMQQLLTGKKRVKVD